MKECLFSVAIKDLSKSVFLGQVSSPAACRLLTWDGSSTQQSQWQLGTMQ